MPRGRGLLLACGSFRQSFRYAPSTRPKKTAADATPVKTHTVSKPLPNGRSKLNPSASIVTLTTPLKNTGQLIGTSQIVVAASEHIALAPIVPRHSPLAPVRFLFSPNSLIAQPSNETRRISSASCPLIARRADGIAFVACALNDHRWAGLPTHQEDAVGANQPANEVVGLADVFECR